MQTAPHKGLIARWTIADTGLAVIVGKPLIFAQLTEGQAADVVARNQAVADLLSGGRDPEVLAAVKRLRADKAEEGDLAAVQDWRDANANSGDDTGLPVAQGGQMPDITARQIRLALEEMGILDQVDAVIEVLPEELRSKARIEWRFASKYERYHPFVLSVADALGLTQAETDQWWTTAAAL